MKIIHITDIHLLATKDENIYGVNPYQNLLRIAENILQIEAVNCIIITGDIAHNGEYESYLLVDELFRNIRVPVYWLQGNHDYSEVMLQVANKIKIKTDKSFLINKTKFILLQKVMKDEDNLSKNKARGFLFDYEMKFLERELKEENFEQCVVVLHHPPILSNSWLDRRILDNRENFISMLEQYPKVKIVLYGHQHNEQETEQNGITYISAPPVAYHFNPKGERFSLLDNKSGYAVVELKSDEIVVEFKYLGKKLEKNG